MLPSPVAANYTALPSRPSNDSNDSQDLRALELSEGPINPGRGRSHSWTNFDFHQELLPLTTSLSEPDQLYREVPERGINLLSG